MRAPITDIFYRQLVPRLEKLPTRAQREAAGADQPARRSASGASQPTTNP